MAAAGLVALNLVFLVVGGSLLFVARGFRSWGEALQLGGLAYLLGVAAVAVPATWLLVLGVSVSAPVIGGIAAVLVAFGIGLGLRTGRPRPMLRQLRSGRGEPFRLLGHGVGLLVLLYLADFLRAARLQSQFVFSEWDAWSSWTTKAKSIYYLGGLQPHHFSTLFMPGYPILVPTLEAMGFHFMGAPDTTLLHVQFWLLLAGFVWAVAGLLRPGVPGIVLWPFVLLLLVSPQLNRLVLSPQADFTMDYFFAAAGLCLALWTMNRRPWELAAAGVLLAGAMCTKREGYLFTAALLAAGLAVTWRGWRTAWPRLAATGVAAALATVPWQLWRAAQHLPDQLQGTTSGQLGVRLGPAASSVAQILLGHHFWLFAVPLGIAAAAAALAFGRAARAPAVLYLVTVVLGWVGMTWALAAGVDYTLVPYSDQNPIPRASGAIVLLSVALAPLFLASALGGRTPRTSDD
jgi:hypothetical protein